MERCSLVKVEVRAVVVRHPVKNGAHGRRGKRSAGRVALGVLSARRCWERMRHEIQEQTDVAQGREGRVLRSEYCQTPEESFHVKCL